MSDVRLAAYDLSATDVREIVRVAMKQLSEIENSDAKGFSDGLFMYSLLGAHADTVDLEDTVAFLGVAAKAPRILAPHAELPKDRVYSLQWPEGSYEWGKAFLLQILSEIREVICSGRNSKYRELQKQYDSYPKAFAVATSTSIASVLGVTQPWALGLSTLVLLTLA